MAALAAVAGPLGSKLEVRKLADFEGLRVLAWDGDVLYASRGYTLLRAQANGGEFQFLPVARYRPAWWRDLTSKSRLSCRLLRDGFHALAVHPCGNLIAAVPGAIVTLRQGESEFEVSHRILRGTRPLHITATPDGQLFWGEYFDNPNRDEVHIYASDDRGCTWHVAHTFPKGEIRHVHNIVYDRWERRLWILTGDYGKECRILRTSLDLATMDEVLAGTQQARAVAVLVDQEGLFFASDTPLEQNHIFHLNRSGNVRPCCKIPSSSIYACRNSFGMFVSTMIEPSEFNLTRNVTLFGSSNGENWTSLANWRKDPWPMKYFQYGNALLPDGENATDILAATTVAVEGADLTTSIWKAS